MGTPAVENNNATAATLTVNNASASTFAGVLQNGATGTLALSKIGTGTLTLGGVNTFGGGLTIDNGTVAMTGGTQTLAGGLTFGLAAANTTAGNLDLTSSSVTFGGAMLVQYNNNAPGGTITVGAGKTMTVGGNVTIGVTTANAITTNTLLTMTGGGTFVASGTTAATLFQVGGNNSNASTTTPGNVTADFSGLDTFTAVLNTTSGVFRVNNVTGTSNGSVSTLLLPTTGTGTTTITANAFTVGDGGGNIGTLANVVKLGSGVNTFKVTTFNISSNSRDEGSVTFAGANGSIVIRDTTGSGRAAFNLGGGGTNVTTGVGGPGNTFDVTGHSADLLLAAVSIGTQNRGVPYTNTFSFDTNKIDMTSLTMSTRTAETGNGAALARTTNSILNIGGGSVAIQSGILNMGNEAGTYITATQPVALNSTINVTAGTVTIGATAGTSITMATAAVGTSTAALSITNALNFTGGTVTMAGNIVKVNASTGVLTISCGLTLNGGTLDMGTHNIGGTVTVDTLSFQSGTLLDVGQINNGGAGVTKTGGGTLTIGGTNGFSGGVALSSGTLNLNSSTALGSASGVFSIAANTTLDCTALAPVVLATNNLININGNFTFNGTNNLTFGTGAVTLGTTSTATVSSKLFWRSAETSGRPPTR